jgi:hypothetical protein
MTYVLYHGRCPDGIMAAWSAWKSLGSSATYIPCLFEQDDQVLFGDSLMPPNFTNEEVYILDFSFSEEKTLEIADQASIVVLLDHHASAQRDLAKLIGTRINLDLHFDMTKSGARLAYDFFVGREPCWIVDYTQDRDLWKWELPYSKEINAYLLTIPHDFEQISAVFQAGEFDARVRGQGCLAWTRYYVDSTKALARNVRFLGHDNIPVVNAPFPAISEVVGELAVGHEFAVGWHQKDNGQVVYSLRSKHGFDVSKLAQRVGGGGHKEASGFTLDKFPWELTE